MYLGQKVYMEELRIKISDVVHEALESHASGLEIIGGYKVQRFEWLKINELTTPPTWETIVSGKEFDVWPQGTVRFMKKETNSATATTLKFWSRNMKLRYDNEDGKFKILSIGDFSAFI